jgi:hypothetical protein
MENTPAKTVRLENNFIGTPAVAYADCAWQIKFKEKTCVLKIFSVVALDA